MCYKSFAAAQWFDHVYITLAFTKDACAVFYQVGQTNSPFWYCLYSCIVLRNMSTWDTKSIFYIIVTIRLHITNYSDMLCALCRSHALPHTNYKSYTRWQNEETRGTAWFRGYVLCTLPCSSLSIKENHLHQNYTVWYNLWNEINIEYQQCGHRTRVCCHHEIFSNQ